MRTQKTILGYSAREIMARAVSLRTMGGGTKLQSTINGRGYARHLHIVVRPGAIIVDGRIQMVYTS